jgi:hypothetical protein
VHNRRVAKNVDPGQLWSAELVRRIGAAMKTARGSRSAKWLSDRTAELGFRVSPTVIAKLDSGHRGNVLSVAELLVLAAALDVAPVALLYPGPYEQETELLPGLPSTEFLAAQWFSGIHDAPHPAPDTNFYQYRQNMRPLRNARTLLELQARKEFLLSTIGDLGDSADDQPTRKNLTDELVRVESDIERYREPAEGESDG